MKIELSPFCQAARGTNGSFQWKDVRGSKTLEMVVYLCGVLLDRVIGVICIEPAFFQLRGLHIFGMGLSKTI